MKPTLTLTRLLAAAGIIATTALAANALVLNGNETTPATPETKAATTPETKAGAAGNAAARKAAKPIWFTDHKKAVELSKKTGRPILFDFTGSDWCPPCKALEKNVFQSAEFKKYSDEKLILLKLDFPRRAEQSQTEKEQNRALAGKYEIKGFPTVLLLDPAGKLLGSKVGYGNTPPAEYLKWLDSTIQPKPESQPKPAPKSAPKEK
jgi:thiol-disulfide isomerase/thioredoxin